MVGSSDTISCVTLTEKIRPSKMVDPLYIISMAL